MTEALKSRKVGVYRDPGVSSYPADPRFGPAERYPEYPFEWSDSERGEGTVYAMVRGLFERMGLDRARFGKPGWNPLGEVIRPGDRVLVKPNLVIHSGDGENACPEVLVTHPSVIRAVLDYVAVALAGQGQVMVGDSPIQSADFGLICSRTGLDRIVERFRALSGLRVELVDFRRSRVVAEHGDRIRERLTLPGDPEGYAAVNLGLRSYLTPLDSDYLRYRVTDYIPREMRRHHNATTHEYLIPKSLLTADAVINLPKLKTHRKGGITCALKNLVGINGNKDWLPHHRTGSPVEGGDEYPERSLLKRLASAIGDRMAEYGPGLRRDMLWHARRLIAGFAVATGSDRIHEGSWYGNDTLWRMVLDLITVLFYADKDGLTEVAPVRSHFAVVDAVVAGEGDGPLHPEPRNASILLGGANPLAVDAVAAALIGLDPRRIPMIGAGFEVVRGGNDLPLAEFHWSEIELASNESAWDNHRLTDPARLPGRLDFRAARGWSGHVELPGKDDRA